MAGKKSNKKKRNISKHVLKARSGSGANTGAKQNKTPPSRKARNTKSPVEATAYLLDWEADRKNGASGWKFNKNTQSWLIRHMYESDIVSKGSFSILLNYLNGLKGTTAKARIRADASRRAIRYKEHTKTKESNSSTATSADVALDEPSGSDISKPGSVLSKPDLSEDSKRWQSLNEHDKRKEYKRARQILENLTVEE
eukprot:scaffold20791_cov137-Cylindrotheca_fusiformis.AAC.7